MTSLLKDLTWTQWAEVYDRQAERMAEIGNARDAEFARLNAATCRHMAEYEGEVPVDD